MKKFKSIFLVSLVLLMLVVPLAFTFAQQGAPARADTCGTVGAEEGTLQFILCRIAYLINAVIPVLIALAVAYFIWGVIQYVIGGDEEAKSAGRTKMVWGLIGLLVIVTIWGLVTVLRRTFTIDQGGQVDIPCIPGAGVTCE